MSNLYPFLSGTLRAIISELVKKGDPIAKEISDIDANVEDLLKIYTFVPNGLRDKIIDKVIRPSLTEEVSMLSVRVGGDDPNVSFLPKDKEPEYTEDGTWARKNRQEGKPAKIFQKALTRQFKQREWETFSNAFKSEVCSCNNFQLVSGEDIRYWYHENNYYECKGTLGNSCMRYDSAQSYFDIYVDNAKMLITKKAGKLTGRAIVWEIDENTTILDRVYTCFDYLYNCFIDYAKEHKWIIREDNSLLHTGEEQFWLTPDDNYLHAKHLPFKIKLKERYDEFPYVDSFRYYNEDYNYITTNVDDCALDSTDGDYCRCIYTCDHCGRTFFGYTDDDMPDELHWSEWYDGYLCDDCCYWSDTLDGYAPYDEPNVHVYLSKYESDRVPTAYIKDFIVTNPEEAKKYTDPVVVIDGTYYFLNDCNDFIAFDLDKNQYTILPESNTEIEELVTDIETQPIVVHPIELHPIEIYPTVAVSSTSENWWDLVSNTYSR